MDNPSNAPIEFTDAKAPEPIKVVKPTLLLPDPLAAANLDPDKVPKHTFHGIGELPVGFHERALAAKVARAVISAPAEVHDPALDIRGAELDIVPDDADKRAKLTPAKDKSNLAK